MVKTPDDPTKGTLSEAKDPRSSAAARGAVTAAELQLVDPAHYDLAEEHARGGMGRILGAHDRRLDRSVAIKVLLDASPAQEARFVREALVTARLQHPAIVPVYEAGRWPSGEPFYAMKLVSGRSLKELIQEAGSLEARLGLLPNVIAVADAIAYAHHEGVVHRDLKPSNVMVGPFGETLVIDWGLAKVVSEHDPDAQLGPYEVAASGLTVTGAVMGTPEYMAPEQAQGEPVDTAADVYSLGAMLYHLLAGRAPFAGESSVEILGRVRGGPPPRLEECEPRVPADLAAIVGKSMERRPGERYPSARELAADLRRFQAGQLVGAHRYSAPERARRFVSRHRAVVASAAVGLLAAATLLGLWLRARWGATEQALLAQRFGQEVERIEGTLRQAYLLPLHDTRGEKALVRRRMQGIEGTMASMGAAGIGPGNYALGRGHLALHEDAAARRHLEAAWEAGFQSPEVAYALGRALGSLYQDALGETRRIRDPALRESRNRALEAQLRDPALHYLKAGGPGAAQAPAYVEGLIALYEKRLDLARGKAQEAKRASPGLYEALRLEGDVDSTAARERLDRGDYDGARSSLERASQAYRQAIDVARSDPASYEAECELWTAMGELDWSHGGTPQSSLARAGESCARALEADDESASAHAKLAAGYVMTADYQSTYGNDPRDAAARARHAAERALRLDPTRAEGHRTIGTAYSAEAYYEARHRADPLPAFDQAIASFRQALRLSPEAVTYNNLGVAWKQRADYESGRGQDPRPSLREAIAAYDEAIRLAPDYVYAHSNRGNAWQVIAENEIRRGIDPSQALEKAVAGQRRALELGPKRAWTHNNLGNAYSVLGAWELARGGDPGPALNQAVSAFQSSLELDPKDGLPYANLAESERLLSLHLLQTGADPGPALAAGRAAAEKAARAIPGFPFVPLQQAGLELVAGRWALRQGASPEEPFLKALAATARGLAQDPQDGQLLLAQAQTYRWRAEWRLASRRAAQEEIAQGRAAADKALAIDAGLAEAAAVSGALHVLTARGERNAGARVAASRRGVAAFESAFRLNALLRREYGAVAEQAARMAQGAPDRP